MNVSFGNVVKLNLPESARNNINTNCSYSGFSDKPEVLNTLGHLKGDNLSTRVIQFLIGDKSAQGDKSAHKFVNVDGDIYMISGPDFDEYTNLRKTAIDRICVVEKTSDSHHISELIDSVEFSNPVSCLILNIYRETIKDKIKDNPNKGRLDIAATPEGYISQMAYNSRSFHFKVSANK